MILSESVPKLSRANRLQWDLGLGLGDSPGRCTALSLCASLTSKSHIEPSVSSFATIPSYCQIFYLCHPRTHLSNYSSLNVRLCWTETVTTPRNAQTCGREACPPNCSTFIHASHLLERLPSPATYIVLRDLRLCQESKLDLGVRAIPNSHQFALPLVT